MKSLLPVLAMAAAGLAAAQERLSEQPYAAPLTVDAPASHYRFTLPAAAYRGAARRDLADIRIFNAAGEPVPYAFAPRESAAAAAALRPLSLFPLYGDEEKSLDATTLRVERTSSGTIVRVAVGAAPASGKRRLLGYLVDASEVKATKDALVFAWSAPGGFSGEARVEASEDLKEWRTLASNAPILFLEHGGAHLERKRVELLPGTQAKYLRVSFSGVPRAFALKEVSVELRAEKPDPAREWLKLAGTEIKAPGELQFDASGHFPIDRLKLIPPQLNTVVQVQFLSRNRPDDPWRPVASSTAYRLGREGGEILSPDIAIPANNDRYWLLKVDQRGGAFGSGSVRLDLGWVPHEIVFAARGAPPFNLAYGSKVAKPGALPMATVLPKQHDGDAALARAARVGEVVDASRPPASPLSDPLRFVRGLGEDRDAKKWILWGALLGGVLLLAGMASKLLREVGKKTREGAAKSETPGEAR
jgi:hypothetical protein